MSIYLPTCLGGDPKDIIDGIVMTLLDDGSLLYVCMTARSAIHPASPHSTYLPTYLWDGRASSGRAGFPEVEEGDESIVAAPN